MIRLEAQDRFAKVVGWWDLKIGFAGLLKDESVRSRYSGCLGEQERRREGKGNVSFPYCTLSPPEYKV